MNIVDIVIIFILLSFAMIGFKRGVINSLVAFLGFIVIVCLSYLFKNILGDFLILNLPFIKFNIGGGSVVLNVVMYQMIAFFVILTILGIVYRILLAITGIVEKILKVTVILGIPSKILGMIVGILEGYIIVYLLLFFAAQPYIKMDILDNSKYAKSILVKTPILSNLAEGTVNVINDVHDIIETKDDDNFDLKVTDLILKEKVASVDLMEKLVKNKKIEVEGIEDIINKYKTGGDSSD